MSKRNLFNLFLFVFILILIVFVIYEPGKQAAFIPPTLTPLKENEITFIKISRNNEDVEFKKIDSEWIMIKPYAISANSFRLQSILKLASTVSLSQNNLTKLNLETFGLDSPKASITFNKTTIYFGHNKSLNYHRYIKIDNILHMIKDTFYYQLTAKADSFISHKLIPTKKKIIKLILPALKLENINGKWKVKPKEESFTADSVTQIINEWKLSQAIDVKKIVINKTIPADIIIKFNDKTTYLFKIEKNDNNFLLTNITTGVQYTFSSDRKDKLLKLSGINQDDKP